MYGLCVDDLNVQLVLCLRVAAVKVVAGLERVLTGGGAFGVDGRIDEVGAALLQGLLKNLLEHKAGQLGVGGDLRRGQEHVVKLLGGEIEAVPQLPLPHGDGEGQDLDGVFLPQSGRDVGGGVRQKFDLSHSMASRS